MRFVKMQGCGNDFILLDAIRDPALLAEDSWRAQVPAMCDRRRGVGADGVIVVGTPKNGAHAEANIINADGSPGGMCGNGLRLVTRLIIERGHATHPDGDGPLAIRMGGRTIHVTPRRDERGRCVGACADMGSPVLDAASIPVKTTGLKRLDEHTWFLFVDNRPPVAVTFVSMGNPHAVLFVRDLPPAEVVRRLGPELEHHAAFPQRMNIQWARVIEPNLVRVVTWERGAGATRACGTGACAVAVAGVLRGKTERAVNIRMRGGTLDVRWDETSDRVWLGGPAEHCFEGEWSA